MGSFWRELRRRNVFRVGIAYLAAIWVLIQVADVLLPNVGAPAWVLQALLFSSALGFPLALFLAWFYELTPEGIRAASEVETVDSARFTGRKIDFAIIGLLVLAVGFLLVRPQLEEISAALPNSVAVLLCDNLSPDPDDAYFAAGIHDEILNQLAKIEALNVTSRTAVLQYGDTPPPIPQVAEELNVETVMECSVRYSGDLIQVTAQLIDPETDSHLWSETYPGDMSDLSTVFAMQADIAMNIANALEAEFSPEEQAKLREMSTDSPEAYAAFLQSIAAPNRRATLSYLEEAIQHDPEFAVAYIRLAWWYSSMAIQQARGTAADPAERERYADLTREMAQKAIELDPGNSSLAHTALGNLANFSWRWTDAQDSYEQALALNPNSLGQMTAYGQLLSFQGKHEEAIDLALRRLELSSGPVLPIALITLARAYAHAGIFDAAVEPIYRAAEINPGTTLNGITRMWLARIESIRGNISVAADNLKVADGILRDGAVPVVLSQIAYDYSQLDNSDDAAEVVSDLSEAADDRDLHAGSWVLGYLAVGDIENAYNSLQIVVDRIKRQEPDQAQVALKLVKSNLYGDPVLDQPRFQALRNQISGF